MPKAKIRIIKGKFENTNVEYLKNTILSEENVAKVEFIPFGEVTSVWTFIGLHCFIVYYKDGSKEVRYIENGEGETND